VTKLTFVCILISFVTIHHWSLYQLDIKNAFMVFLMKRFIWSNYLVLLLRGSLD